MLNPSYLPETTNDHFLYLIIFPNLRVYVGITANIRKRWQGHRADARKGSQLAVHRALRKYPEAQFVQVERGPREKMAQREMEIIAALPKKGRYNSTDGGDLGVIGLVHSAETRAKMSASKKGRKLTPEHIAKSAAARKGGTRSDESRARMSAGQKARIRTPEEINRIRIAAVGRVVSDQHRARLSAAATERWRKVRENL